jgi:hypothetical protein
LRALRYEVRPAKPATNDRPVLKQVSQQRTLGGPARWLGFPRPPYKPLKLIDLHESLGSGGVGSRLL